MSNEIQKIWRIPLNFQVSFTNYAATSGLNLIPQIIGTFFIRSIVFGFFGTL